LTKSEEIFANMKKFKPKRSECIVIINQPFFPISRKFAHLWRSRTDDVA